MEIPVNFKPRDYQIEAIEALDNGCRMNVWCWSRRGGKDWTAFNYAVRRMVETPMNVVLVFPTKEQGKNSFWNTIENDGFHILDHIPSYLRKHKDNNKMIITLKNGSTFQILGATEPDALRGANARIYIFSEFVDIPAGAVDVIRPVVANNNGQIILQSTPKIDGISGGTFKMYFDRAKRSKNQFASRITADLYMDPEVLEEERQVCIEKNGNDFWWRQEYMCDWGQASSTAYYAHILQQMRKRRKLGNWPHNPSYPVFTAWDLGTSDSTAITFFQIIEKRVHIIDYYETHNIGYKPIVEKVQSKSYDYAWHFIPHDGAVRDQSDAVERIEKLKDYGLENCSLLKRESKEDGIRRTAEELPEARINRETTKELVRKATLYKRKHNGLTGDYEGPEHKTESHAADSLRYVFVAVFQDFSEKTREWLYSPEKLTDIYESDLVETPAQYNPTG